jgi:hypothetical protein
MSKIRTWPARIYLQRKEEDELFDDETTWCRQQVNDDDVEYVRIDLFNSLKTRLRKKAECACLDGHAPNCPMAPR